MVPETKDAAMYNALNAVDENIRAGSIEWRHNAPVVEDQSPASSKVSTTANSPYHVCSKCEYRKLLPNVLNFQMLSTRKGSTPTEATEIVRSCELPEQYDLPPVTVFPLWKKRYFAFTQPLSPNQVLRHFPIAVIKWHVQLWSTNKTNIESANLDLFFSTSFDCPTYLRVVCKCATKVGLKNIIDEVIRRDVFPRTEYSWTAPTGRSDRRREYLSEPLDEGQVETLLKALCDKRRRPCWVNLISVSPELLSSPNWRASPHANTSNVLELAKEMDSTEFSLTAFDTTTVPVFQSRDAATERIWHELT